MPLHAQHVGGLMCFRVRAFLLLEHVMQDAWDDGGWCMLMLFS
jgi:hypothetical protein